MSSDLELRENTLHKPRMYLTMVSSPARIVEVQQDEHFDQAHQRYYELQESNYERLGQCHYLFRYLNSCISNVQVK